MNVVELTPQEIEPFVRSIIEAQEGAMSKANIPFLTASWEGIVEKGLGKVFAIRKHDKPAGFLMALFTRDMITGDLFAIQYLWMVNPLAQVGRGAFRLYDAFEAEAKAQKCKKILGGYNRIHRPWAMRRMFLKRGYKPFSEALSKDI